MIVFEIKAKKGRFSPCFYMIWRIGRKQESKIDIFMLFEFIIDKMRISKTPDQKNSRFEIANLISLFYWGLALVLLKLKEH